MSEKQKIYVVLGTQGEYSDREEWVAGVYLDKETAIRVAEDNNKLCKEQLVTCDEWTKKYREEVPERDSFEVFVKLTIDFMDQYPRPPDPDADDYTVVEGYISEFGRFTNVTEKQTIEEEE